MRADSKEARIPHQESGKRWPLRGVDEDEERAPDINSIGGARSRGETRR
ncbi:MAG: hypothetical protein H5U40_12850 [Polyangiaceae bacterium]|nr:hypothetical protein [Polyangiaceae bacterium]